MNDDSTARKSLFALIADLPRLVIGQVRNEIEQFKSEMIAKLKHIGIGAGLFIGAGFVAFCLFAVLITAVILAFATVVPGWLAALIVAAILLVIMVVLLLIGVRQVKRGVPPTPTKTITSVKKDVNTITGLGKRESR